MRLINHKSDFEIRLKTSVIGSTDDTPLRLDTVDWVATFVTSARSIKYEASRKGDVLTNARIDADGSAVITFDRHGLPVGPLRGTLDIYFADANFPDGSRRESHDLGVVAALVCGDGDRIDRDEISAELDVLLPLIKGDKGEPLRWEDLTEAQKAELSRPAVEAATSKADTAVSEAQAAIARNTADAQSAVSTAVSEAQSAVEAVTAQADEGEARRDKAETERKAREAERIAQEQEREKRASVTSMTLDYGAESTRAEFYNLTGAKRVAEVRLANVESATLGGRPLEAGVEIADGAKAVIEITRQAEGDIAAVGLKLQYL